MMSNHKINWKQEVVHKAMIETRLTKLNLHPGYFHLIEDNAPHYVRLVYLELSDDLSR